LQSFDDVLSELGEFGRYQKLVYFFLFLPTIFSAMHKLSWVFIGASPDHRCRMPGEGDEKQAVSEGKSTCIIGCVLNIMFYIIGYEMLYNRLQLRLAAYPAYALANLYIY
jgi:hypothetical protein